MTTQDLTAEDHVHLFRCVELAEQALQTGDKPFGSVLVAADGTVLAEDHNRTVSENDPTLHPESTLARWAAKHLDDEARRGATVYTSGEHCPMCAAAHAWVGLGRIVYIVSAAQLTGWRSDWDVETLPVAPLPISQVAPQIPVTGPVEEFVDRVQELHRRNLMS